LFCLKPKKPQEYRINISLISRIVKLEGIRESMEEMGISVPLWQFDNKLTCRVSIDFTDVTVANAFMSVIKSWERTLDEVDTNPLIKKIRPFVKYLPTTFKYGLLLVGSYYTFGVVDKYFASPEAHTSAVFLMVAYLFNLLLWKIGLNTGKKSEKYLNQLYEVSYIYFSGADKKLANECSSTRRKNIIFGGLYLVGTFLVGVLASWAANYIFKS
jgi:hypothetical protein